MKYTVAKVEFNDDDDDDSDPTWDAEDWCYTVNDINDEIVAICASRKEADHIATLLNSTPVPE